MLSSKKGFSYQVIYRDVYYYCIKADIFLNHKKRVRWMISKKTDQSQKQYIANPSGLIVHGIVFDDSLGRIFLYLSVELMNLKPVH